jgi:hypothetical protein
MYLEKTEWFWFVRIVEEAQIIIRTTSSRGKFGGRRESGECRILPEIKNCYEY